MLTRSCFILCSVLAYFIPTIVQANNIDRLKDEYQTAVMQHIGENKEIPLVSFLRANIGKRYEKNGADFVYLWHGVNEKTYDLLNIIGMTNENENYDVPIYFSGVDTDNFNLGTESKISNELNNAGRKVEKLLGVNKQLAIGYDLGAAAAFKESCVSGIRNIAIVAGGLYKDENCKPTNTKVVYAISDSDSMFPINKSISFESKKSEYSTIDRLDGSLSVKKLVSNLECTGDPLVISRDEYDVSTYHCSNENELTVVIYKDIDHQWFGYKFAVSGELNQYGNPASKPVAEWIENSLGIK